MDRLGRIVDRIESTQACWGDRDASRSTEEIRWPLEITDLDHNGFRHCRLNHRIPPPPSHTHHSRRHGPHVTKKPPAGRCGCCHRPPPPAPRRIGLRPLVSRSPRKQTTRRRRRPPAQAHHPHQPHHRRRRLVPVAPPREGGASSPTTISSTSRTNTPARVLPITAAAAGRRRGGPRRLLAPAPPRWRCWWRWRGVVGGVTGAGGGSRSGGVGAAGIRGPAAAGCDASVFILGFVGLCVGGYGSSQTTEGGAGRAPAGNHTCPDLLPHPPNNAIAVAMPVKTIRGIWRIREYRDGSTLCKGKDKCVRFICVVCV